MTLEDGALMAFIMTKDCRRRPLSRFQDGDPFEADCVSLNAELCDNCKNRAHLTVAQKRTLKAESKQVQKRQRTEVYDR